MSTEERKLNIYERLLAITSKLSKVGKNLEVGVGQNKYKAVGEADVLAAIKPLEEEFRVYSYPVKREIVEATEIESVYYNGTTKKNFFLRVATTYRFINIDKPDEFIEITSYGDGVDSQDKAPGKAMTYSDKYALMKAYKIITGDDPDQNPSEELKGKTTKKTPIKAQNVPNIESFDRGGINTNPATENPENEPMTPEQLKIIVTLDSKLQNFACKKYQIDHVSLLSKSQAEHIIKSLTEKGVLK